MVFIIDRFLPLIKKKKPDSVEKEITKENNEQQKTKERLPKAPFGPRSSNNPTALPKSLTSSVSPTISAQVITTDRSFVPKAPFAGEKPEVKTQSTSENNLENEIDLASLFSITTETNQRPTTESTTEKTVTTESLSSTPLFSTSVPKKKNKPLKSNGSRPTRFEKFKGRKHSKNTKVDTVKENTFDLSLFSEPTEKSHTSKFFSETTPRIPILKPDTEPESLNEFNYADILGLDSEFGSGSAIGGNEPVGPPTFLNGMTRELDGNQGTAEFLRHFNEAKIAKLFFDGKYL